MFITCLVVNFAVSFTVWFIAARVFRNSITRIMRRLVIDDISAAAGRIDP